MADAFHYAGGDLSIGPTGDIAIAGGSDETRQRVLRRLVTNPAAYLFHLGYGAGLPGYVGQPVNARQLGGVVRSQMLLEAGVQQIPPPAVAAQSGFNSISLDLNYVDAIVGQPVTLSFDVTGGS